MKDNFDIVLDECIDRINRGENIASCMADFPDYTERLEPLLRAMVTARDTYRYEPSPVARRQAREKFDAAIREKERKHEEKSGVFGWLGWPKVWVPAAVIALLVIGIYFGFYSPFAPGGSSPGPIASPPPTSPTNPVNEPTPTLRVTQPNPEGNFVFLISDDVNAIADFESVTVDIAMISLHVADSQGSVIEFEPEIGQVDLTLVQGDATQQIWRGDIPEGSYNNIILQVVSVRGILKETGEEIEIKVPGQKLHISKSFEVGADTVTTFTYDITVIATGNPNTASRYIIQPQIEQSGVAIGPAESKTTD